MAGGASPAPGWLAGQRQSVVRAWVRSCGVPVPGAVRGVVARFAEQYASPWDAAWGSAERPAHMIVDGFTVVNPVGARTALVRARDELPATEGARSWRMRWPDASLSTWFPTRFAVTLGVVRASRRGSRTPVPALSEDGDLFMFTVLHVGGRTTVSPTDGRHMTDDGRILYGLLSPEAETTDYRWQPGPLLVAVWLTAGAVHIQTGDVPVGKIAFKGVDDARRGWKPLLMCTGALGPVVLEHD